MFSDHVGLHMNATSHSQIAQCSVTQSVFYERKLQPAGLELIHGKAYAVYCYGTVQHEQRFDRARHRDIDQERVTGLLARCHDPDAIDVALNDVPPEPVTRTQRALEVESGPLLPIRYRRAIECRQYRRGIEPVRSEVANSETGAVYRNAFPTRQVAERRTHAELATGVCLPNALDLTDRFDQPGKHLTVTQRICGHHIFSKLGPPYDWLCRQ